MINTGEGDPKFFFGTLVVVLLAFFVTAYFLLPSGFFSDSPFDFGRGDTPPPPTGPQAPGIGGERTGDGCVITGCSSQVCASEEVVTTCEYKEEYACYQSARCERQADGVCGWTPTSELEACLKIIIGQ